MESAALTYQVVHISVPCIKFHQSIHKPPPVDDLAWVNKQSTPSHIPSTTQMKVNPYAKKVRIYSRLKIVLYVNITSNA